MDRRALRAQSLYGGPKQAILLKVVKSCRHKITQSCNLVPFFCLIYLSLITALNRRVHTAQATLHYLCGLPLAILLL